MIIAILLCVADTPMSGYGEYDVDLTENLIQIRELVFPAKELLRGNKSFVGRELRPLLLEVKITAVVVKTDDVNILQILPSPVMTSQLTEVGILAGDVVPLIIRLIALDGLMECGSGLYRQKVRMLWKRHFLMGANENLNSAHSLLLLTVMSGMQEIRILTVNMEYILQHTENKTGNSKGLAE